MDYILLHMAENGRGIIIPTSSIERVIELSDGSTMVSLMNENIRVSEGIDFIYKKLILNPIYIESGSYPDMKGMVNTYKKKEGKNGIFEWKDGSTKKEEK